MSKTKLNIVGNPIEKLEQIIELCTCNSQIIQHLKRNTEVILFLREITGINSNVPLQLLYHYKEKIPQIPLCICGKQNVFLSGVYYRPTCGDKKCKKEVREISKKSTCMKKYGVEFVTQLDSMKEKSKETLMDRFGVDNSLKSPEIIAKRKQNNLIKYGVEDPIALLSVRGKTITDANRGLIKIQEGLPEGYIILESDRKYYYKMMCPKKHIFNVGKGTLSDKKASNIEICNICNEYIGSNGEQDLFNYVSSIYSKNILRSNRKLISPFEIDMVLEDIKLCIEFNGDYWHSIKVNDDQYYHLNKLNMCLLKGYKLIQVRENDWNLNKEIIKRKIYNIINNIIDMDDFTIIDNQLILDLSWYDDRIIDKFSLIETKLPEIIKIGKEHQWNCGYKTYG